MKNKFCNCFSYKDLLIVWILLLGPISIVAEAINAGKAFYGQVILNNWRPYKLRVTPDSFRPCEGIDYGRFYCGLRKVRMSSLPRVETV